MIKDFVLQLEGETRKCTAELVYEPEIFLKTNITVFKLDEIDFKATVYTNPSFSGYSRLVMQKPETLLKSGISLFTRKFSLKYLSDIRKSGINIIYSWDLET